MQSAFSAGIGGRALFLGRPQDSFGIGVFRYNLSNALFDALSPDTKFRAESALEAYYSYAMTRWFFVGGDIQYIKPAAGRYDNALVLALRTQIRF